METDERKNLIMALEVRAHIAKVHKQGFVDLTYTMVDRIIAMLKKQEEQDHGQSTSS